MAEEDEDKTAFYAGEGVFCYKKMSFGLKNAGATYQRVLQGAKLNYPAFEKLVLALVHAARRLQRYFQAHTITVLTNTPIKQILTGPEKIGRVAKWAIELGEHDIMFLRREEIEMPADFLVKIPSEDNEKKEKPKEVPDSSSKWRLYTHGASKSDGSGAGLMLIDPKGKEYTYALRFEFETTNNKAEYEVLLVGLRIAQEMEIAKVFRVPQIINSKEEIHFKEEMFTDLCKGLKITLSFSLVTEHMEIMHHIGRQLTQSQQGWVDNLAKTLWIHITLPRNSEKETSFSLTYGSKAVIPIIETTDDRGRVHKSTNGKESKEVALIELEYYRNKL
ncbi:reverse transcriptase domain-containing protein [Tanacetum coccineum]|uniref:Reverse transcriptase domain-containing protein n=1 Tax=Tanacetum coccineum TaxID=301880 RepID=A0ABQ5AKU9_9ASTR